VITKANHIHRPAAGRWSLRWNWLRC